MKSIFRVLPLVGIVWTGLNVACASDNEAGLPLAAPPELRKAKLLYSRDDGIYLRTPGDRQAGKLVEDAAYPRWSPDGKSFAFIRDQKVMLYEFQDKKTKTLAEGEKLLAVAFHPHGKEVWFINGKSILAANISDGATRTILDNIRAREIDIASDGSFFAATIKRLTGYNVEIFDAYSGKNRVIGRGCSASISPDMLYLTVNTGDHTKLSLRHQSDGREWKPIIGPAGLKLDNQKWSNHQHWIVSISEGAKQYVMVHRVNDGKTWRITPDSDCDRPDLYIP